MKKEEMIIYKWNDTSYKYLGLSVMCLTTVIVITYMGIMMDDNALIKDDSSFMSYIAIMITVYYFCNMIYYATMIFDSRTQIKIQGEKVHYLKFERRYNGA